MNQSNLIFYLVVGVLITLFILYKMLKPYIIAYDTTILFCGGLGSGKTFNSVKMAVRLYKKNLTKIKIRNFFNRLFKKPIKEEPLLISNLPIKIDRKHFSTILTKDMLILNTHIPEYSVVMIDELPQLVNQFNWGLEEVKHNLNEFITFFRHYIGGYLICNGQAESEIVKQVRVKLNSYYWCFDFQKFWLFYRFKVIHSQITENDVSISTEFIEDKTKFSYGIFPLFKRYDSRCYRNRYKKVPYVDMSAYKKLTTNDVIRFDSYKSKLDGE